MSEERDRSPQAGELDLLSAGGGGERVLDGLLDAQRAAVCFGGPRLMVVGAAGTGKTRVVCRRFRRLVQAGLAPERIGVLVPTRARATALAARLEVALAVGYEQLFVLTPGDLAGLCLRGAGGGADPLDSVLTAGDRLAMLVERIDELSLQHHDFGGRPNALLGGFVRRIDRLKAELVGAEDYAGWAASAAVG